MAGTSRRERGPGGAVYSATKHAIRVISEGLRQEVKPYNIRSTIISPGAVATELPDSITEPDVAKSIHDFYERFALPPESFARMVALRSASLKTLTSTKFCSGRRVRSCD